MEVTASSTTNFDVNLTMSDKEVNQLTDELEAVFALAAKEGKIEDFSKVIEFKNLLTLSVNNSTRK